MRISDSNMARRSERRWHPPLGAAPEERAKLRSETEIAVNLDAPGHVEELRVLAPAQHRGPNRRRGAQDHLRRLGPTPCDQEHAVVDFEAKQAAPRTCEIQL